MGICEEYRVWKKVRMDVALRDTFSVKVSCVHEEIKTQKTKVMGLEMEFEVFKEGRSNAA